MYSWSQHQCNSGNDLMSSAPRPYRIKNNVQVDVEVEPTGTGYAVIFSFREKVWAGMKDFKVNPRCMKRMVELFLICSWNWFPFMALLDACTPSGDMR